MNNALHSQALGDLNEHRGIVDEDNPRGPHLGYIQSKSVNILIGLADVNEAGGYEAVSQPVQLEPLDPICIQLTGFIADDRYLQSKIQLKLSDKLDHFREGLRLREHKAAKLIAREGPPFVEDNQAQILFKRDLALLEDLEREAMAFLHVCPLQFEALRRPSARQVIPPIGQEDVADIQKYACDASCRLHQLSFRQPA
jgi:hypothetical protein